MLLEKLIKEGGAFTKNGEIDVNKHSRKKDSRKKQKRLKMEVSTARDSSKFLPKTEPLFRIQKWVYAVRRKDFLPSPISVLCAEHFLPKDFLDGQEYKVLKKLQFKALPSKFEVIPLNFSSKGRKRRLSESHQDETDENMDDIQIIAVQNNIDSIEFINMDHSYAFPSDIVALFHFEVLAKLQDVTSYQEIVRVFRMHAHPV
ncbi:unnamed protein product [Lepeophtheirus salmonis]|uniref:(salmon louse) hypothetical protein n=1 Tax=Lepeophtheirus salmonis TaxID=72036 RepID=A0A7R8D601_LEPSM|nr:unnamed protein product [Lepeophtheirus salmonis]CAF3040526.1 unnamed protein product [Lepeophtheirus salmonis]